MDILKKIFNKEFREGFIVMIVGAISVAIAGKYGVSMLNHNYMFTIALTTGLIMVVVGGYKMAISRV